jgi:hypothetical protein
LSDPDTHKENQLALEERKALAWSRRGYVVLLGLVTLVSFVLAAIIVVGLSIGESRFVMSPLALLPAPGATGALIWRTYIERFVPRR